MDLENHQERKTELGLVWQGGGVAERGNPHYLEIEAENEGYVEEQFHHQNCKLQTNSAIILSHRKKLDARKGNYQRKIFLPRQE